MEKTVYLPLYACCSKEVQELITKNQPAMLDLIGMCTAEEGLAKIVDYSSEFVGMYDK